ncbi:acyltransferase [Rhizobium sp.]
MSIALLNERQNTLLADEGFSEDQLNEFQFIKICADGLPELAKHHVFVSNTFGEGNVVAVRGASQFGQLELEFRTASTGGLFVLDFDANRYHCKIKVRINGNDNLFLVDNAWLSIMAEMTGSGNKLRIGKNTSCGGATFWIEGGTSIDIGKDCMLAWGIMMRSGDAHAIFDIGSMEKLNQPESVVIDDHVWIGHDVFVQKGAAIGSGSVVASGSIVTRKHGKRELLVGAPAKCIRQNVTWTRQANPTLDQKLFAISHSENAV